MSRGVTADAAVTCAMVAAAMTRARNRWWIIRSAAVALHGVDPGPVGHVDLLASAADLRRLADANAFTLAAGTPDARFRSLDAAEDRRLTA